MTYIYTTSADFNTTTANMQMIQVCSILLVITSGILCSSGTQQGLSSTQAGQTLQIQPNVRKYNKHTVTEKPCTTAGSTTGTRKDKPENGEAHDYAPILGGQAASSGYPYPAYPYPAAAYPAAYPYPYPYPYRPPQQQQQQYPAPAYEPQYPPAAVDGTPGPPYYAPYYYPGASPSPYYPAAPLPYPPAAYPSVPPSPYEQSTVVDAYRSPLPPYLHQQQLQAEQYSPFYRQPGAAPLPYYYNGNTPQSSYSPNFRAHAYNRPATVLQVTPQPPAYLQQRDAAAATNGAASASANNGVEAGQYEQQQSSGSFDGNQFHF